MTKICLIAGNYDEALAYAKHQSIPKECWFYPKDENDLLFKKNFYVLVVGTAGQNVPVSYFNKIYSLALKRGQIERI